MSSGQGEKAAAEFQSLLASKPRDAGVKTNLIGVLIDLKRMKEAQALNGDVLRQNPKDPQALVSNGRILIAEGKNQEAVAALQAAIRSEPNCAICYYFLGDAQAALGRTDEAKASVAQAHQLAPQMSDATAALAHLNANAGDYDEALKLAGSAVKANPALVSAWVTEARALIAKGDLAKANGKLEEALKRDDANLPAVSTLLGLYTRQGKTQAAAQRISKLVEQDPKSAGLHVLLGEAWFNVKDLDKAEANARQALALDPNVEDGYSLLANTDLARGALDQARTHFRAAIDANPTGLSNYMSLELLSEREGNWEEARRSFSEKAATKSIPPPRFHRQQPRLSIHRTRRGRKCRRIAGTDGETKAAGISRTRRYSGVGLLQARICEGCRRPVNGIREQSSPQPRVSVPLGDGASGRWPPRSGQAVFESSTRQRSSLPRCRKRPELSSIKISKQRKMMEISTRHQTLNGNCWARENRVAACSLLFRKGSIRSYSFAHNSAEKSAGNRQK